MFYYLIKFIINNINFCVRCKKIRLFCSTIYIMILYFILFSLIGFIPYVSVFIGLQLKPQFIKRIMPKTILLFVIGASFKLFMISVVLPELQGHNVQTFLATMFINSVEFIVFKHNFIKNKVKNTEKGNIIAFGWAAMYAFATSSLVFSSN